MRTTRYISSAKEAVAPRVEGGSDCNQGGEISPLGGEVKKKTSKKAIGMFLTIISRFFWEPESIKHTMIEYIVKLLGGKRLQRF